MTFPRALVQKRTPSQKFSILTIPDSFPEFGLLNVRSLWFVPPTSFLGYDAAASAILPGLTATILDTAPVP